MAYTFEHNTGTAINEGDPWRPINVFVHAPGQIGQIVKCSIYDGGWVEDVYYHYDALGNVMGYSDSNAGTVTYEMDAFGNRIENSTVWESMTSLGPKEHLTGKMLDDDTGLYYFHARWYDPQVGRFIGRDPMEDRMYLYCGNSPLALSDPTGLLSVEPGEGEHPLIKIKQLRFLLERKRVLFERSQRNSGCLYRCFGLIKPKTDPVYASFNQSVGFGKDTIFQIGIGFKLLARNETWYAICYRNKNSNVKITTPGTFYQYELISKTGGALITGSSLNMEFGLTDAGESEQEIPIPAEMELFTMSHTPKYWTGRLASESQSCIVGDTCNGTN